jgi:hypothetical protein
VRRNISIKPGGGARTRVSQRSAKGAPVPA